MTPMTPERRKEVADYLRQVAEYHSNPSMTELYRAVREPTSAS